MAVTNVTKIAGRSPEVVALKIELVRRGWRGRDLAEKAQVHHRVIRNLMAGNNHCWPPRAAINQALGQAIFKKRNKG